MMREGMHLWSDHGEYQGKDDDSRLNRGYRVKFELAHGIEALLGNEKADRDVWRRREAIARREAAAKRG